MSHYRVAVFANHPDDFDRLLEPYSETDEKYFEFIPLSDESLQWHQKYYDEHRDYPTFEEFMTAEGYVNDEKSGMLGYYGNPNAKWDYYTLDGGLWEYEYAPGHSFDDEDNARKNDFDYRLGVNYRKKEADWKRKKKLSEQALPDDAPESAREEKRSAAYFIKENPDLGNYLKYVDWKAPYAFITPDGVWHSPGTVGWFAVDDSTPESMNDYMKEWVAWIESDENPYVNFVDCHI